MNAVEIFFSPTGGTEKVAHMLGGHWSENSVKIDLSDAKADYPGRYGFGCHAFFRRSGTCRGNRTFEADCGQRRQMHPRLCVR